MISSWILIDFPTLLELLSHLSHLSRRKPFVWQGLIVVAVVLIAHAPRVVLVAAAAVLRM